MEPQVNQIVPTVNQQGQLSLSSTWGQNLQPEESQIIRAKYGAPRFATMDDTQISKWGKALLIKIAVITGWVLPTKEALLALVDQFTKKLTESYANCNNEEVEYAFRNHSADVEDWGKQVNLSLIDKVMRPYLMRRRDQSDAEERALPPSASEIQEDISEDGMEQWLLQEIQFVNTGKPFEYLPVELYDYLDNRGEIQVTRWWKEQCLFAAIAWRQGQLQQDCEGKMSRESQRELTAFKAMRNEGCFRGHEAETLKRLAKKVLLHELLKIQK